MIGGKTLDRRALRGLYDVRRDVAQAAGVELGGLFIGQAAGQGVS